MSNYSKLLEQVEIKGISNDRLYWMLFKHGFELWVNSPFQEGMNKYMQERNSKAIEQALIEVDFMI